ncbi:MAG TPA: apolipoprotein N-acyltransferase [Rhizomicrobium sp.]|nr:apolipoprotein N-acyltransferase [Rhizomicrobium sp.]
MTPALLRAGQFLRGLAGWRAALAAFGAGIVSACAFPPLDVFPAFVLAIAALVLLLDGAAVQPRPVLRAALVGWAFGFGQFMAGMHWIFYPFLVDPVEHAWEIPFAALLFPGGLALFPMFACIAARLYWRTGASRIFMLALCYAVAEWLRGHVLTGLPWNLPAYGWGASLAVLQSSAVIGAYGLSLLTVLFGASLAELFAAPRKLALPLALTALFAALWLGGELRLAAEPTTYVAGVRVRLVQPDVPQDEKYVRSLVARNWQTLIDLSTRHASASPTVIIWPEAAPPVLLQRTPEALDDISVLTGARRTLVTGNQRVDFDGSGKRRFFNSLFVFGPGGRLAATYDKFHLVPFGEYLPLEAMLRRLGITKLVGFPGSFASGDGPHTVKVPGAPDAGPLICYEILFPGAVIGESRPGWLINVTDDSWFGPWAGPQQHFLAARVRAIEEGLPVARAANTGISGMIDPVGRTIATLGLDLRGDVDTRLPKALMPTPYAEIGDLGFALLAAFAGALVWLLARK